MIIPGTQPGRHDRYKLLLDVLEVGELFFVTFLSLRGGMLVLILFLALVFTSGLGGVLLFRAETIHPAGNVDQLLFAGVERMALGAYFDFDRVDGSPCLERVTAAIAGNCALGVFGVYTLLHILPTIPFDPAGSQCYRCRAKPRGTCMPVAASAKLGVLL